MAKEADKYFKTDAWSIVEEGFDEAYSLVSESIFSQANEYMGTRGFFEEGYSGSTLVGSYFNGIYISKAYPPSYKGMPDATESMVNAVNWLYTRMEFDGEELDLHHSQIENYQRTLDFQSGLLTRTFIWNTKNGKKIKVIFERFVSMQHPQLAAQKIRIQPVGFDGTVQITAGLDFSIIHQSAGMCCWDVKAKRNSENAISIAAITQSTNQVVRSAAVIKGDILSSAENTAEDKRVSRNYTVVLHDGQESEFVRVVKNEAVPQFDSRKPYDGILQKQEEEAAEIGYQDLLLKNRSWWGNIWEKSDITIEGDEENQQGIRFCIFQMYQTYHGAGKSNNIGAKGLTGEAYNGNAFWDTETYCLPFFALNHLEAAKSLLMFRYETLGKALLRAEQLDCKGAFYPIATISGVESCGLWQHSNLQLQASTGVAYGIWFYDKLAKDNEFLYTYGLPMLIAICRMLASRGGWNNGHTKYGYYCVMGPDEFQMMVNHNCYTNYMGRFTLNYTLEILNKLKSEDNEKYCKIITEQDVTERECSDFKDIADHMYIPYHEDTKLYEQHDGYFDLPHIDVDSIPIEAFPLYHHWAYDRIYRNDMIKQPDVLMFMLLFPSAFSLDVLKQNYAYYEPRCIHESSLSPSVHSILACRLNQQEEAYQFFRFATRLDLDNYNRNTNEGLHTTSIAAAWMNIVYGFGGLRSDLDVLELSPSLPAVWDGYSFRLNYHENVIVVQVERNAVHVKLLKEEALTIKLYGQSYALSMKEIIVPIPERETAEDVNGSLGDQ